jgi:hypothetical protein
MVCQGNLRRISQTYDNLNALLSNKICSYLHFAILRVRAPSFCPDRRVTRVATSDAVRVDARDAPVGEVLAALGRSFGLRGNVFHH